MERLAFLIPESYASLTSSNRLAMFEKEKQKLIELTDDQQERLLKDERFSLPEKRAVAELMRDLSSLAIQTPNKIWRETLRCLTEQQLVIDDIVKKREEKKEKKPPVTFPVFVRYVHSHKHIQHLRFEGPDIAYALEVSVTKDIFDKRDRKEIQIEHTLNSSIWHIVSAEEMQDLLNNP